MSSKKNKEALDKASRKGGTAEFRMGDAAKKQLLVCPPTSEEKAVFFTGTFHILFMGGKFLGKCGSPAFDGERDKIADLGWALKDKYAKSSNKKKQEAWRMCMPSRPTYVNVIDLTNEDTIKAGPMIYNMSGAVAEVVLDEIKDIEEGDGDLTPLCDFDEGKVLQIRSNGEKGLKRRYKAKFLSDTASLIEDGVANEVLIAEWADKMTDLESLQPKFVEEEYEKYFSKLKKILSEMGIDVDAVLEETPEDEDDMEEFEDEDGAQEDGDDAVDDDEIDSAEFDDDDDDDGEFEDDSDSDSDDGDFDDDDDDFDDEEEEEEKPAPRRKKKTAKKAPSKKAATRKKASGRRRAK